MTASSFIVGELNIAMATDVVRDAAAQGLYLAGEHILNVSNEHVPHEDGDLQGSGAVSEDPEALEVAISYDSPYAARQHEELTWRHDDGRTAKYLENAVNSEAGTVAEIVAAAVRGAIGG